MPPTTSALYPKNPNLGQSVGSNVVGAPALREVFHVHWQKTPTAASNTSLLAATASASGLNQAVTTQPDVARNITATTTGTGANVLAVSVVVTGTDISGAAITETLPAFSAGSLTTVVGNKAFATVTNMTVPATGASTNVSIGTGSKLGLHHVVDVNTVGTLVFLNKVKESVAPTVGVDAVNLCNNTCALNSAIPGGQVIDIYYSVSA